MNLLSMLGGSAFVMFNKELAHEVSVNGAIIFGQLCSSYESFGSKDMLTIRDGKEYFFLTSEVIEEETALTYKQQSKEIKDLEEAGYIETVIMGTPAKKYFHITNKIIDQFSSDKKEKLNEPDEQENPVPEMSDEFFGYDKRENQAFTKEQSLPDQKVMAYKENKEKYKNIKNNFVNKESVNNDNISDKLIFEYINKGLSKQVCLKVLGGVNSNKAVKNFGGYFRICLENALEHSQKKHGLIECYERYNEAKKSMPEFFQYDWLEG
jgi:hypothetical protein